MERRFAMKRDGGGMLYHRSGSWGTQISFGLCDNEVNQYFDIADDAECALVLSTVEHKNSYGVSKLDNEHLQLDDPDEVVWVDEDIACAVGALCDRTKRDIVYLSLEVKRR